MGKITDWAKAIIRREEMGGQELCGGWITKEMGYRGDRMRGTMVTHVYMHMAVLLQVYQADMSSLELLELTGSSNPSASYAANRGLLVGRARLLCWPTRHWTVQYMDWQTIGKVGYSQRRVN